ncbi:hypothetical protein E2C01_043289 [Portunus trituberculatus]|uniref:Uncharacterized protein n=1 Tax=Portunus trituberculatus TaxID=210409 RepID=A0A5B7FVQ1_PORTR|nr:hypothetical protein [Portunus trituberculatus]
MRDVRLFARHNHLCYAFTIQRWVSDTETVIIPGKINIIPPRGPQLAEAKRQRHFYFGGS